MITLTDIMKRIAIPEEVREVMLQLDKSSDWGVALSADKMDEYMEKLTEKDSWVESWKAVKKAVTPDERGFKILYFMLRSACHSYKKYRQRGISDAVFVDTMKCFTRFIGEYRQMYGRYGFDRDFWVGRQLSLQLFRFGELEYEKIVENGENLISIHIPSDAVLSKENCRISIELAKHFFRMQDKAYADVDYCCDSWLLSPVLKKLLPASSRIRQFQEMFIIQSVDEEAKDGIYWIFKKNGEHPETLPEETTLQRNAKHYLMAGGTIGSGKGILKSS